jgi:hypothetical protein
MPKMTKNPGRPKITLAANEVRQHAPRGSHFFIFIEERVEVLDFFCSHQAPNEFPTCPQVPNVFLSMFPIAPHFIPYHWP